MEKYPLYKENHSLEKIVKNFEELKTYDFNYKKVNPKFKDTIYFLIIDFDKEEKFIRITDYFTEECRIACNFANEISPLEYFNLNKEIINATLGKTPSYEEIDYYLYKNTRPCTLFQLPVAVSVLRYFKPKRWLDPSAGWGDRLIAAINYGECDYRATDPNECLHPKYKEIIDTFTGCDKSQSEYNKSSDLPDLNRDKSRSKYNKSSDLDRDLSRSKYKITQEGFEVAEIEANYYDLVFTSPPFFDLEKYSDASTQSHIKYKTLDEWMDGFMYPFLIKSVAALSKGGHLCLYVEDNKKSNIYYVKKIRNYLNLNKRMKEIGNIVWKGGSRPKKIMVYQKIK